MLRKSLFILTAALFAGSLSAKTVADLDHAQQQQLANAFQLYQQRQFEQAAPLLQAFDDIPQVQYLLGRMSLYGQGVTQDYAAGKQKISQAAAQHYAKAQYALARLLDSVEGEPAKALELYRQAAEQDYADAQFELAEAYSLGHQVTQDDKLAIEWFTKAASNNHVEAQNILGTFYRYGSKSLPINLQQSAKWHQKACDNHDHFSCDDLSIIRDIIQESIGRARPEISKLLRDANTLPAADQKALKTAVKYYRDQQFELAKSILEQYPQLASADVLLAITYEDGALTTPDQAMAFKFFRQAAEKGDTEAQYKIARIYQETDLTQALYWYQKAEANNHVGAQHSLGDLYRYGLEPIALNIQHAMKWYQKACDNNYSKSCTLLSEMREMVQHDIEQNQPIINELLSHAETLPPADQQAMQTAVEHYRQQQFELAKPILEQYPQLAAAELLLAKTYAAGMLTARDRVQALRLFRQAAAKGYPAAQFQLAQAYHFGYGDLPMDFTQALDWYHKAAASNDAEAQYMLGGFYQFGIESIEMNLPQAAEWYQKACANGNNFGCFNLKILKINNAIQ